MKRSIKRLAISLNVAAALLALVGSLAYVNEHSLAINPVLLYFGLLVVSGIPGTAAILSGSAPLRSIGVIVHMLTLFVLGTMFLMAWMLSPGSGLVATPFLVGAAIVNILSLRAIKTLKAASYSSLNMDARQEPPRAG